MNKTLLFILAIAPLLTACVAPPDLAYTDPRIQRAAADEAIRVTAQAQLDAQIAAAQEQAADDAKTENELERLMAPLRASQTALALANEQARATDQAARSTDIAREQYAQATDQASRATSTQYAAELSLESAQRAAAHSEQWKMVFDVFGLVAALIVLIGGAVALVALCWRLPDLLERLLMVKVTKYGVMVYKPTGWQPAGAVLQEETYRSRINMAKQNFTQITPSVYSSSTPDRGLLDWAKVLVKDSIDILGDDANYLASVDQLQRAGRRWNAERRQAVVDAMEANQIVIGKKGSGVFLVEYDDLAELYNDLLDGRVRLSPSPSVAPV